MNACTNGNQNGIVFCVWQLDLKKGESAMEFRV